MPITQTNEPPTGGVELVVFPQRDFVSAAGLAETDTVTVEVEHAAAYGGGTVSSTSFLVPQDDPTTPEFDGLVEVNHPGAYGWGPVTPDIRPGDRVRLVVDSGPRAGVAHQTTVAGVTAKRPVQTAPDTVQVHGTAPAADGGRIALDQLEHRLISPGNLFALGGRRTLRTGVSRGATLAYDTADGAAWTATYTGLTPEDVTRALEAESVAVWLGRDPAAGAESTIYEIGADVVPGPQGPGNGPLEQLPPPPGSELVPPSAPAGLGAAVSGSSTVTLTWDAATDDVGVTSYGVYRDGVAIANVQAPDGAAPAPTTYVDKNVPPGDYVYTVDAADEVGNRSAQSQAATATTTAKQAVEVPLNQPPAGGVAIVAFPSRDFIEVEGVPDGQVANVEVFRAGRVISTADGVLPTGGFVEVNHPGGACWDGVTPELRAADLVRVTLYDGATGDVASRHQIRVAEVAAAQAVQVAPDTVVVRGYARAADGGPLPLGEIEARLVSSSKEPFGKNGRRTLRAPEDGTIAYDADDPLGTRFTATFAGLDATDVRLALSVEARIMWLGRDPLAGVELTIYEAGSADLPGPAAGFCSSPLEALDTQAPTAPELTAEPDAAARSVALAWTAATDDTEVHGYRVSRDGTPVADLGTGARTFTDAGVAPGEHSYVVQAIDTASPLGAGASPSERLASGQGGQYGNASSASAARTVVLPDVAGPSTPTDLAVTNPAGQGGAPTQDARITFAPSTDDAGVVGYRVYRDGVLVDGLVPALVDGRLVATDTALTPGATYRYAVDAVDAVGNASPRTAEVPVVIAADTTPPAPVPGLVAATPDVRSRDVVLTWDATTDSVDGSAPGLVTAYGVYRDGVRIATVSGTTLAHTDAGLAAGTYAYEVDAVDSAGNRSGRTAPAASATVANDPPAGGRSITAFPARDFVEGTGYTAADGPVTAQVLRRTAAGTWRLVSTSTPATPDADGVVEVNHAGPDCWTTTTPDIRPGDVVRLVTARGVADQTVVQDLTVQRPAQTAPGTVVVRGTARPALGLPVDAGRLEQRIVSEGANFAKNGRNALLAGGDGTLVVAADGSFTATYTGLSAADVTRALAGESIVTWLGRDALLGNELTIMENGEGADGGPAAGVCTAPLEPGVPQASVSAGAAFGDVAPGTTSAVRTVALANASAVPVTVSSVYLAGLNPGDFAVAPVQLPAVLQPGQSLTASVTFTPAAVGARTAVLGFVSDAANTTNLAATLTGTGVVPSAPSAPTGLARGVVDGASLTGTTTVPVRVSWTAPAGTALRYQLQRSVAGGAFADVSSTEQPGTATSAVVQTAVGSAVRFQVRACNDVGCSAWTTAAATTFVAMQENTASVAFRGTWPRTTQTGAWGGSVSSNAAAATSATLRTAGTGYALVSTRGPDRGRAEVWMDGVRVATVDLYAPTRQPAVVVWSRTGLTSATRSVELRVLGTRTAPSTGSRVDLDGFVVQR